MKTLDIMHELYSDQTCQFLVTSVKGNKSKMIVRDRDSNAILGRPLKTKSATEQMRRIQEAHMFLNDSGVHPKIHVMDNEYP